MAFEPLRPSLQPDQRLLTGPDGKPLQFSSLTAALQAAGKLPGDQAVVIDDQGSYLLVNRDALQADPATGRKSDYEPARVAFEVGRKQVVQAGPVDLDKTDLLALFLKGDGQLDEKEMALLAHQLTDEQGMIREGPRHFNFRDRLVDALQGPARPAFDALIERLIKQRPQDFATADMAMLNVLAGSPRGAAMITEKLNGMRSPSGLLTLQGRTVVERLLGTGSGRRLIAALVVQALDTDSKQAMALLRALSSSTTARRYFYQQLAHPEQPENPLAVRQQLRPAAREYVALLQQMNAPDRQGVRLFNLQEELLQPDNGFIERDHDLTPAGLQMTELLQEGSGTRKVFEVVGINNRATSITDADRQAIQGYALSDEGREVLRGAGGHLRPEVRTEVNRAMDQAVRQELLCRVYDDLSDNRYGRIRKGDSGQINRGGRNIDCYDAAWDIVSAMQGVKNAQPRGQQHVVKGVSLRSRAAAAREKFVDKLRVGDVLHVGPPGTHWVVYVGKDDKGTPQVMHGNWGTQEYVPDGKGDTQPAPADQRGNSDRGIVITSLAHVLDQPSYGGNVQTVYRPGPSPAEGVQR